MSDLRTAHSTDASPARRLLGWLGTALLLALVFAAFQRLLRPQFAGSEQAEDPADAYKRELWSYVWGIGLALMLTGVPFAMVHWHAVSHFWLLVTIGTFALVQIVVHFQFFLHIDLSKQKREDLELILFSTLILMTMAGGTIWILSNLAGRMH